MWSEREANYHIKSLKLLLHYLIYFGKIRNVVFRVLPNFIKPSGDEEGYYSVSVQFIPGRLKGNDGKVLASDISKLCSMIELCPDAVLVDKKTTPQSTYDGTSYTSVSYRLQSINNELPFICSDFFK